MLDRLRNFFDEFYSFLFRPYSAAVKSNEDRSSGGRLLGSMAFVSYISVILGITTWFFISYPEPLYYGTSNSVLRQEVPSILMDNPLEYLFGVVVAAIFTIFLYTYCLWGAVGYFVLRRFSDARHGALGKYLSCYANSLTPLLFWVPVMVLRSFFFERWIPLSPLYPFIDWTAPNLIHQIIIGGCLIWKFVIEVRLNQGFFGISAGRAMLPVLGQALMLTVLLIGPAMYNDLLFDFMKDNLT
jgi:hypothetical protein